jgi:hypothetical protein
MGYNRAHDSPAIQREAVRIIESIFVFESTGARQGEAHLLEELEQYLSYMLSEGVSKQRLRTIGFMLHVIRLMDSAVLEL